MNKLNKKIKQAFENVTPNVLGSVLSDCEAQKGDAIPMTVKKKPSHILNYAATAAALLLLFGVGAAIAGIVVSRPNYYSATPTEQTDLISAKDLEQLNEDILRAFCELTGNDFSEIGCNLSVRHYWNKDGAYIFFVDGLEDYPEEITSFSLLSKEFLFPTTQILYTYKDGKCYEATHSLYQSAFISHEQFLAFYEYHRSQNEALYNPSNWPAKPALDCPAHLTSEKRAELEKVLGKATTFDTDNFWQYCRYYGTYEGYDILLQESELFASEIEVIAGQAFACVVKFTIYAHKDGQLLELADAYEQGLVSRESIKAAYAWNYQEYSGSSAVCCPYPTYRFRQEYVEDAWKKNSDEPFGTWYSEDNPDGDWRFYSTDILFYSGGNQEEVFTSIQIGDSIFSHPTTFQLYYYDYANQEFVNLEEVYAQFNLQNEVAAAAQLHAECQKAVFGEDWLKKAVISQADASELALAHIMEKTTLTRFHITRTGFKTTVDEQGVYYKISFDSPNKTFVVDINANNGSILNMSSESLLQLPDNLPKNLHTKVLAIADEMIKNTSWLNMSLLSKYAEPADIDLYYLFYNGFDGESQTPTEEEYSLLKDNPRIEFNLDLIRLPVSKMDTILQEYFGISFAQTGKVGLEHFAYLEETDCYYSSPGGSHYSNVRIKGIAYQDDGSIIFSYIHEYGEGIWKVTIQPTDNGYRILSNLPE